MSPPPERQKFSLYFLTTFLVVNASPTRHLQRVHLYGPFAIALSGVTCPLHRHLGPFTTTTGLFYTVMALMGPFYLRAPARSRGSGVVCAGSAVYKVA